MTKFYLGKLLPGDGVSGQYHEIRHALQDPQSIARSLQAALQSADSRIANSEQVQSLPRPIVHE